MNTWTTIAEDTHLGHTYQVGYYEHLAGIRWRIPYYFEYRTQYVESQGAFYDDAPDHPEGAVAWAEASVRRYIERAK
jgi:hypothetical protein